MKLENFADEFESATELPIAYYQFREGNAPSLPWAVYYTAEETHMFADDGVYYEVPNVILEVYTEQKDLAVEETVKSFLRANEIPYAFDGGEYLDDEKMQMGTFSFDL